MGGQKDMDAKLSHEIAVFQRLILQSERMESEDLERLAQEMEFMSERDAAKKVSIVRILRGVQGQRAVVHEQLRADANFLITDEQEGLSWKNCCEATLEEVRESRVAFDAKISALRGGAEATSLRRSDMQHKTEENHIQQEKLHSNDLHNEATIEESTKCRRKNIESRMQCVQHSHAADSEAA